ncbi:MAG TPA: hypothetical protein VGH28_01080 [Polyangiaceae bacterium]|jgi:hypothetical protein
MNARSSLFIRLALAIAPFAFVHCGGGDGANDGGLDASDGATAADGPLPGDAAPNPDGGVITKKTVGNYVGVNGLIADSVDDLAPIGVVREYHNWGWIADNYAATPAYPNMLYTFMNFNGWDWDAFFAGLQAKGVSGFPAVQGSVPWMNNSAIPPVPANADKTLAASYVAHADAMFQIAARYGSTKVPDAQLKLKANQTRSTGLGTVQYFEDFNEQDNSAAFTPDAFAAMASADDDGDQGRLGPTFGVKSADPNAKLVMGGLSGKYPTTQWVKSITDYLDGMRTWSSAHRSGSFPADVVNVHLYSFGSGGVSPALSPEADDIKGKLAAIVAYRDANLPGKELWWTEFGYDSDSASPLGAPQLGSNSSMIVQAQWLVRDLLIGLALGIDRATLFELDDTGPPDANQFTTCGLITSTAVKKPAWYFVATFRARLATMAFAGEQASNNPSVTVYKFKDTAGVGGAYVVWSPTSAANVVSGYALAIGSAKTVSSVTLTDKQQNGVEAALSPSNGTVKVDVLETPLIVLVDAM